MSTYWYFTWIVVALAMIGGIYEGATRNSIDEKGKNDTFRFISGMYLIPMQCTYEVVWFISFHIGAFFARGFGKK